MPAGLDCHFPAPQEDGQESRSCDYIEGGRCYDGGGLVSRAEHVFQRLVEGGDDALWATLESEYVCRFEKGGHSPGCGCAVMFWAKDEHVVTEDRDG